MTTRLLALAGIFRRRCITFSMISGIVMTFASVQYSFADTPGGISFTNKVGATIRATCYGGKDDHNGKTVLLDHHHTCGNTLYMKLEPEGCAGKCDVKRVWFQDHCKEQAPGSMSFKAKGAMWDISIYGVKCKSDQKTAETAVEAIETQRPRPDK